MGDISESILLLEKNKDEGIRRRELQASSLKRKPEVSEKSLSRKQAVLSSLEDSGMAIMSIFTLYFLIFLTGHCQS